MPRRRVSGRTNKQSRRHCSHLDAEYVSYVIVDGMAAKLISDGYCLRYLAKSEARWARQPCQGGC